MAYKEILEMAVSAERFKIDDCINIQPHLNPEDSTKLRTIKKNLSDLDK